MRCPSEIIQVKLNKGRIPFDKCLDFTPLQTNFDKIRNMSTEELADFLTSFQYCDVCEEQLEMYCSGDCRKSISEWLRLKVENNL